MTKAVPFTDTLTPPRLRAGDRVRFVSPASPPSHEQVMRGAEIVSAWGLRVEIGAHAFDAHGHFLAGRDEDRLADINDALRDPGVRAIVTTRGGKGSYRIADGLDVDAARRDPKPLVGFSDVTILHLARWHRCRVGGFHGPHAGWEDDCYGAAAAEGLRRALMAPGPLVIEQDRREATAPLTTDGTAEGILMGGNLGMIAMAVGWSCPSFAGAILLIEDIDKEVGFIDRALTQILKSGVLEGVHGVAVGQFVRCAGDRPGKWSAIDVLRDRLSVLGVPVLGGLPIGHGPQPATVPLGTHARIDTAARTLVVSPGVL
jgi:muramoyltetrapeptide carboxypeptidase